MIRQNNQFLNPQYVAQAGLYPNEEDAVYYNLSLNKGVVDFPNNIPQPSINPASFNEINQTEVLTNTSDYYVSVMRCTIPTAVIPRMIMPVVIGQADINLMYNYFVFLYRDATGTPIYGYSQQCLFQPEIYNPSPIAKTSDISDPLPPLLKQDTSNSYYYVYYVDTLLKIFNTTLAQAYNTFRTNIALPPYNITLPAGEVPFYTYDNSTQLFSFNAPQSYAQSAYPRVEVYTDGLTVDFTNTPSRIVGVPDFPADPYINNRLIALLNVDNLYTNSFVNNSINYYKIEADQSAIVNWGAFQKIVFQIGSGISTLSEIDAIPTDFQGSSSQSFQKPNLPMLCDFEVDREQWAKNTQYIQFTASSITQVRLISIQSNNPIQNFSLSVYWVDNFGIRRLLSIPALQPITVKLAFFKKTLKI